MDYTKNSNKRRKRRQRPHVVRLRNTIGVLLFRIAFAIVLIGGFALAGIGIGVYIGILNDAQEIHMSAMRPGVYNSVIIDARTGEELVTLSGDENREWVHISEMPQHLLDAFVAIEDERFFSHNGIDIRSMARALHVNLTTDRVEGASTITQQLIKNMQGMMRNDFISKLQEQYLAVQFERYLTEYYGSRELAKEHILESYLNMINLGRNWHGVQVAAWNYFGKNVYDLTLSESAVIAAITRNPSRYLPDRFPEHNRYRQLIVLDNMLEQGMITEWEHRQAVADPVHDRVQREHIQQLADGVVHSYFTDALITQVVEDLVATGMTEAMAFGLVFGGGLRIYSTQDSRMQQIVDEVFIDDENFPVNIFSIDIEYHISARNEITGRTTHHRRTGTVRDYDQVQPWIDAVRDELLTPNDTNVTSRRILMPQPQAAVVVMDQHTGHVKAISGGRGEKTGNRHFCRATVATRSPGSQFKVLAAFLPGVDLGMFGAGTHIMDEPLVVELPGQPPWAPRNWWGGHWEGPSSVRRAIYHSMNVVSVRAYMEVGGDRAFDYLTNLGFTTLEGSLHGRHFRDTHYSVPLGGLTLGVTQLELAAAFATIANEGLYNRPVFYTKVLDRHGEIILENRSNPRRVISEPAAYLLTNMMVDTVTRGTGTAARFRNVNMPVSGKTGTSQHTNDLGFTGFTPHLTAAVWLGFDTPQTIRNVQAPHTNIWRLIMERIHAELADELPHRQFIRPDGVVSGTICTITRMAPSDFCRSIGTIATDLFVVGTIPSTPCDGHPLREMYLCILSGAIAGDYCPEHLLIWGMPETWERCHLHGPYDEHELGYFDPHELVWHPEWGYIPLWMVIELGLDIPTQPPPDVPWYEAELEYPLDDPFDDPPWYEDIPQIPPEDFTPEPEIPEIPPEIEYIPEPVEVFDPPFTGLEDYFDDDWDEWYE